MVNPILAAKLGIGAADFTLTAVGKAIAGLYGVADGLNDFMNRHIDEMQASDNPTIERTGRILAAAKFGFGLGYLSSVVVISVGQIILGNTLSSFGTVAAAATLTNPIAMTCAAMGAILYGWSALNDTERNDILDKLSKGLEIGAEMIRAIVSFVIRTAQDIISSKALKEFKAYIADKASLFGRSLGDVTRQTIDILSDAASAVSKRAGEAMASTAQAASAASERVGETLSELSQVAGQAIDQTSTVAQQALENSKAAIFRTRSDRSDGDGPTQP